MLNALRATSYRWTRTMSAMQHACCDCARGRRSPLSAMRGSGMPAWLTSGARGTARIADEDNGAQGELPIDVTVMQALTKGAKFDDVVEKCDELGARRVRPVICARSYAAAGPAKLSRWRRTARAAAQQSRRRIIPLVDEPLAWSEAIAAEPEARLLVAYEAAPPRSFAAALGGHAFDKPIAIAVGPEGGFSSDEIALAMKSNAALVSLGPTVLRTE